MRRLYEDQEFQEEEELEKVDAKKRIVAIVSICAILIYVGLNVGGEIQGIGSFLGHEDIISARDHKPMAEDQKVNSGTEDQHHFQEISELKIPSKGQDHEKIEKQAESKSKETLKHKLQLDQSKITELKNQMAEIKENEKQMMKQIQKMKVQEAIRRQELAKQAEKWKKIEQQLKEGRKQMFQRQTLQKQENKKLDFEQQVEVGKIKKGDESLAKVLYEDHFISEDYQKRSNWIATRIKELKQDQILQAIDFLKLEKEPITSELGQKQKEYFEKNYKISQYQEWPICVVIPSYNNVEDDRYLHNMRSILQQDYDNFRIIFIDDQSSDGMGQLMQNYAREKQISKEKLKIVINEQRKMAMVNLRMAAYEFCKPHEIYFIIDGDDELIGKQVFKLYSYIFQEHKAWVGYSNYIGTTGKLGASRNYGKIEKEKDFNFRQKQLLWLVHPRAFISKLFTFIKDEDLKDSKGRWFKAANDAAMFFPIIEMAHERIKYIPEVNYLYADFTSNSNVKTKRSQQSLNLQYITSKKTPYKRIDDLFTEEEQKQFEADLGRKIPLKDYSLPSPGGNPSKEPWEIDWEIRSQDL